jgi:hypothetical protein
MEEAMKAAENMTLSRALRYKKRVVTTIRSLEGDVQNSNTVIQGEERDADVRLALNQRAAWVKHLMDLKQAIQTASAPISRLILELAETKAEISFVQQINTRHGLAQSHYRDEPSITYDATIRKSEKDTMVETLQDKIDDLQTRIDAHNATTQISLSTPELP